jgi:hypothetical protein
MMKNTYQKPITIQFNDDLEAETRRLRTLSDAELQAESEVVYRVCLALEREGRA